MSISPMDQLYASLEKICPQELTKLQSPDVKEKQEALKAIVKKVLLTEKSGNVEFTAKPKLWALVHFFRKLVGYSTKAHTGLETALETTRKYFKEPPADKEKYNAMRQILNEVINKTHSGIPILPTGSSLPTRQRHITPATQKDTPLVNDLGKQILNQAPPADLSSPLTAPPPPPAVTQKQEAQEALVQTKKEVIDNYRNNLKPHVQASAIHISPDKLEACFANLETKAGAADIAKLQRGLVQLVTAYENKLTTAYDISRKEAQDEIHKLLVARRDKDDTEEADTAVAAKSKTQSLLAKAAGIEFADLKNEAMEILTFDLPQTLDEAQKLVKGGLKALVAKKEEAFATFFAKVASRRQEQAQVQKQAANAYRKLVEEQIDPKMQYLEKTVNEAKQAFERDIRALAGTLDKTTSDLDAARKRRLTSNVPEGDIKKLENEAESLKKQIDTLTKQQKAFADATSKALAALQDGIRMATPNSPNWKESLEALRDAIQNIAPESGKPISDRIPEILQRSKDTLVMLRQNDLKVQYQKELIEFPALSVSEAVLSKAKHYLLKEKEVLSQLTSSANGKFVPTLVATLQQKFPLVAKNFPSTIHSFGDLRTAIVKSKEALKHLPQDTFLAQANELMGCFDYITYQALSTLSKLAHIEKLETQNNALTASTNDPLVTSILMRQKDFLAMPKAATLTELETFLEQADEIQIHDEILKQLTQFINDPEEHAQEKTLTDIKALLDSRRADFTPQLLLICCQTMNSRTGKASTIAGKLPTVINIRGIPQTKVDESSSDDEWK